MRQKKRIRLACVHHIGQTAFRMCGKRFKFASCGQRFGIHITHHALGDAFGIQP